MVCAFISFSSLLNCPLVNAKQFLSILYKIVHTSSLSLNPLSPLYFSFLLLSLFAIVIDSFIVICVTVRPNGKA